ncbi:MAG: hypothetical protein IIB21_07205 [Chloroflexi bacterium]|nr:hypothetical protein [Chloroflexota bacterium]
MPTYTPTPPAPTPTTEPGAVIFTGTFDVTEADVCGGGTFALTLTSDGTGIVLLSVVDFIVSGSPNNNETSFEPPVDIAGDGSFFSEGPLPPPLEIVLSTFQGTFDFGVDPATVSGTLTIALVADPSAVLCEATFSGEQLPVGAEPPPPPPPAAADEPAPGLPATGTSGGTGSSSNGALWAMVAGIIGVVALGSAGVASLRRRQV